MTLNPTLSPDAAEEELIATLDDLLDVRVTVKGSNAPLPDVFQQTTGCGTSYCSDGDPSSSEE